MRSRYLTHELSHNPTGRPPGHVEFPTALDEFKNGLGPRDELAVRGRYGPESEPDARHEIDIVQVRVEMQRGLGDEGAGNAERALIDQATPAAASVVRAMLDWARTVMVRSGCRHLISRPKPSGRRDW
ncbi:MAG: hypothetical protein H0U16_09290 [Actinobacteria bacterium]|nr:hypothetical protein [Actinomycetota bacterium]